ncbi:MAG: putative inorganic carbon transporter subunit DabA [Planctomycetaceae bacterium]
MPQLETQDLPVAVESHSHRMPLPFLQAIIREAFHHLPCQGPVEVFVHHNTLHAFEHQPFSDAVLTARNQIGGEPYLDEQRFRQLLESARIRQGGVARILRNEEGQHPDPLIGTAVVISAAINGISIMAAWLRIFPGTRVSTTIPMPVRPHERIATLVLLMVIAGGGLDPQTEVASWFHAAIELIRHRDVDADTQHNGQSLVSDSWVRASEQ